MQVQYRFEIPCQFMLTTPTISSRNTDSGLLQRTIKNLDFLQKAFDKNEDVHPVAQVVNSLLIMLVFTYEGQKGFMKSYRRRKLGYPADSGPALNAALGTTTIVVDLCDNCTNMKHFFRRLRNALAHRMVHFDSENSDLTKVTITFEDQKDENSPIDWRVRIRADDVLKIARDLGRAVIATGG